MYQNFTKTELDADNSAMETRDHSRLLNVAEVNGVSPKNQRSRGISNYL